jgi:hypothetical protein
MGEKEKYIFHKRPVQKERVKAKVPEDDAGLGYILVFLGIISAVLALYLKDTIIYGFSIACFIVGWWKLKTISKK